MINESEPLKVYELAKELGMDSISLLEKLKTLNITVKSHMSGLTPAQADLARTSLTQKETSKKAPAKRTTVRKRATETAATPPSEPVATQMTAAPTATQAAGMTASAGTDTSGSGKKAIVRRRTPTSATQTLAATLKLGTPTPPPPPNRGMHELLEHEEAVETHEAVAEAETPSGASSAQAPVIPGRRTFLTKADPNGPRLNGLKIVQAKPPTPVRAPGTSDLKARTPSKDGTAAPGYGGTHIIKMNKESLDKMAADEAAKRRPSVKENLRPEDVKFSDYRKKEMVFLPRRKRLPVGKDIKTTRITTPAEHKRVVQMGAQITVSELAHQMNLKAGDVIRKLMGMGHMANMNSGIDYDTASLIAGEFKWEVKNVAFDESHVIETQFEDKAEELLSRPPVVTIMGHVDHGKTTLLDSIRETNVAAGEKGGITQHIGAYTITKNDRQITFIDTPGHEAFTGMRARGADVTDIVILVVAADDGVMPQTREALSHAQAAKVPIIVAVNKMDKPGANLEKTKQSLAELNLLADDWGGEAMFVPVSALKKTGIDKLLEAILLQADVLDLKANPTALGQGTVLESRLEKGRGPVATLLLTRGTLGRGDLIVAGESMGRVRALMDWQSTPVDKVTPGMAAEVLGLESVPEAGDQFFQVKSDVDGRKLIGHRQDQKRAKAQGPKKISLEDLMARTDPKTSKDLKIILKADVFGSVEAIKESLLKATTEKVKVSVIHAATGGISESDVLLASASNAIIFGFNVRPEPKAQATADREKVSIRCYGIIYELIDEVKKAMAGMLERKRIETVLGRAEVRQTFTVPKLGMIAGCAVTDGKILRSARARLLRDNVVVFDGKIASLRRFKDDAREVASGYECGIGIEGFNDIKVGDAIEAYDIEMVAQELDAPIAQTTH